MVEIRLMQDCPFKDAHYVWNHGFSDYYANVQISLDNGTPVGILMNGIKVLGEKKWAWNGGTNVVPTYRRRGISKMLMEASINLYKEEGVDIASLEVFRVNEPARRLYKNFNYQEVDRLLFLELNGMNSTDFLLADTSLYHIKHAVPHEVRNISFYDYKVPWKTNWNLIQNGQAIIAKNEHDEVIGYALYQKKFDQDQILSSIILYQCVVSPYEQEQRIVLKRLLYEILLESSSNDIRIVTYHLPSKNRQFVQILKEAGFKEMQTLRGISLEQVFMIKEMC